MALAMATSWKTMMMRWNDLKGDQVCISPYCDMVSRRVWRFLARKISGLVRRVIIIVFEGGAGVMTGGRLERSRVSVERGEEERRDVCGVASDDVGDGGSVLDMLVVGSLLCVV